MGKVVEIRKGVLEIQNRHAPGKLRGFYRALCKSHQAASLGGWSSANMLTASIVKQMLDHGNKLWWDLVDLEFGSLASPDSSRDEIGIRTLAGETFNGVPSQPFMIIMAVTHQNGVRQEIHECFQQITPAEVNARIAEMLSDRDFPTGGLDPMMLRLGDAIEAAKLRVESVLDKHSHIKLNLQDPNEEGLFTAYSVHIYPDTLLKDIDLIKASLATKEGTKQ
jgi:hypothetical protein